MTIFSVFAERVKNTQEWADMVATVENSPWHREANVARHTEMVDSFYTRNLAQHRSASMQLLTRVAILFHDFGKPAARTPKQNADGTTRHIFAGHEILSARSFENFMMDNRDWTFETLRLNMQDFRAVRWMIENHLPYDLKKPEKRREFKRDLLSVLGDREQMFYDLLLSDSSGRISDNQLEKLEKVEQWIEEFKQVEPAPLRIVSEKSPEAYVLVGASGSGKSTFVQNELAAQGVKVKSISLDQYRIDFFLENNAYASTLEQSEIYHCAFQYAVDHDSDFKKYYQALFMADISKKDLDTMIVIDNTNLSRKSRAYWISALRQKGYVITAVEFPISVNTLTTRKFGRSDKQVPLVAVIDHYNRLSSPVLGAEVDKVWVYFNNTIHYVGNALK